MGFQGDVAGLGLGELLQGLARGGREGLLTLHAGGMVGSVGVRDGQLHLLPEPDEDPETWRRRSEQAWVKALDFRIDNMRMEEIAYAARLEVMFELLDGEGVHFRFEPGPLPTPGHTQASGGFEGDDAFREAPRLGPSAPGAVHCSPISVEFLLLEHARLGDECAAHGDYHQISPHDVPRVLDAGSPPPEMERFWKECDGVSNVIEISDRLGWPRRRCQAAVLGLIVRQLVRIAHSREMLVLAAREIADGHFARAASRLSSWVRHSEPGPPPNEDVDLLVAEWHEGRLPVVLASMEAPFARTLLRRMDLAHQNWQESIVRWTELRKHHTHDLIADVRLIACRVRSRDESDAPTLNNLLRVARSLQEVNHSRRAGVILRVAAQGLPETTSMRLELGTRMLAVGLVEEGAPWVLEAARALVDSGLAEKAIQPLRTIIAAMPTSREARQLLNLAVARSAAGRRKRRNVLIGMACLLIVSLGAVVEMHLEREFDRRLVEVSDHAENPRVALAMLEERFAEDVSPRVGELRQALVRGVQTIENEQYEAWIDRYRECQLECTLGDPKTGLERALEMPDQPVLEYVQEIWPPIEDLFSGIAGQIEQTVAEWDPPTEEVPPAEERLSRLVVEMQQLLTETETRHDTTALAERLGNVVISLEKRQQRREQKVAKRLKHELLDSQDSILARARAEYKAGNLARSVETYEELFATRDGDKLRRALQKEFAAALAEATALSDAVELAHVGRHDEALERLKRDLPNPRDFMLPWKVSTQPSGAQVRFSDGTLRQTPFEMMSALGENVNMTFDLDGFEPFETTLKNPGDVFVRLSVAAEIGWTLANRVEAPPVAVGENYLLCDRSGHITCVAPDGTEVWSHTLDALGGVARAPVFLPKLPGWLLCLTEDGDAYLIDTEGGQLKGPWSMGSPPVSGPSATSSSVVAQFKSGQIAEWETRLVPTVSTAPRPPDESLLYGSDCGMRILRNNGTEALDLDSHDRHLNVRIADDVYLVTAVGQDGERSDRIAIRRAGEWGYVAWEAPRSDLLRGRLWISDEAGLRGIEP